MIPKISLFPIFTSKVYVANFNEMKTSDISLINSNAFLSELKILEKNGNKDLVLFTPDTDPICSGIFMSVSKKVGNHFRSASGDINYVHEIPELYAELQSKLDSNIGCSEQKGQLVKYLI